MSNLTRYNLEWFNRTSTMDNFHQMVVSDEGAWVKFDDIKELLNSLHSKPSTLCCKHQWAVNRLRTCKKCGAVDLVV